MANVTSATTSTMPVMPSYRPPTSPYHQQPVRPSGEQLVFAAQSTGSATAFREPDRSGSTPHTWTYSAPLSAPTSMTLRKRQVVLEIEVITVVNVVPKVSYPNASPVAVTVTVPPPANTMISNGGWPIINPGSAAACCQQRLYAHVWMLLVPSVAVRLSPPICVPDKHGQMPHGFRVRQQRLSK
ncbi:uncharacterized protein PGTG_14754 [Puccinia graminis f. sp. tritici CRL 75-36-700-3]|uniref:Uncharacterized protein n=1 Tax=Puccinia graminis f. sp. tritici (strain CRL 75-36-700-3 / race SCCL) TaxID=418459 RepID=E3KW74_PUCGT|nr:uncharacterized protein PGTG_14754 [Puccinia graminis f. sp. tritici CRL 75-36-700-3]EFP88549.2 hypothetical protein PGTG_14754 [Puccinia graminis f. sp. tritici CRL 75-36-700-3]